jgi:hypothetical protein
VLRLHPNPAPVTVRLARLAVAAVLLAACQGPPRTARAVVIDTISGTGNTSAPADDPGWKNVGVRGIGTGVYLGNDWVLTAYHVGGGSIVLGGGTYATPARRVGRSSPISTCSGWRRHRRASAASRSPRRRRERVRP